MRGVEHASAMRRLLARGGGHLCGRVGKKWQHGECVACSGGAECVNRGSSLCSVGGGQGGGGKPDIKRAESVFWGGEHKERAVEVSSVSRGRKEGKTSWGEG
jgi:hypothetical protein